MCRRTQCADCGKPTYSGCGAHIEQVLHDVPAADRCKCRQPHASAEVPTDKLSSWLRRQLKK